MRWTVVHVGLKMSHGLGRLRPRRGGATDLSQVWTSLLATPWQEMKIQCPMKATKDVQNINAILTMYYL